MATTLEERLASLEQELKDKDKVIAQLTEGQWSSETFLFIP